MYPNQSYAGYQTDTIGVWSQTSISQSSQGMGYALPFVYPEMATYVEKAQFSGAYPAISFGAPEGDCYQQHYVNINPQPSQWTQSDFQQYMFTPQYHRIAANNNDRQRAAMPNTTRPPPSMKTDSGDNTFHASLSMLENATQNSAAAYTASWVSSTSSIPPELRDEPEVPSFNGSAHDGYRDDLSPGFASPSNTFTEQFSKMSIRDKHWPDLGMDGDSGSASSGNARRKRMDDRERRARGSPKELTWEERIRKGAVQKERVEQRGFDKLDRSERDTRENNISIGRHKGQRGERLVSTGKSGNCGSEVEVSPIFGERFPTANYANGGQPLQTSVLRARTTRSMKLCAPNFGPGMADMRAPLNYRQGVPLLFAHNAYYPTRPPFVCFPQQDQRFRNTWLDASLAFNCPTIPMMNCAYASSYGYRGRMGNGRSGHRYQYVKNPAREIAKLRVQLQSNVRTGYYPPTERKRECSDTDDEEEWIDETEEEKRKRWEAGIYWPFEKENLERERLKKEAKEHTKLDKEQPVDKLSDSHENRAEIEVCGDDSISLSRCEENGRDMLKGASG